MVGATVAFPTTSAINKELVKDDSNKSEEVDVRQGYNNYPGQQGNYPVQPAIYPGNLLIQQNYPVQAGVYPGNAPVSGSFPPVHDAGFPPQVAYPGGSLNAPVAALPGQQAIGGDVPPHPLNSRPSYAYDSAYPDEVNFALADPHRNVAAALHIGVQSALGGATELLQTGYQGKPNNILPAVSASAAVVKAPSAF